MKYGKRRVEKGGNRGSPTTLRCDFFETKKKAFFMNLIIVLVLVLR
jgi:hypothetical protein